MASLAIGINPVLELLKNKPDRVEEVWVHLKTKSGKKLRIVELARKHDIPVKVVRSPDFNPPKVAKNLVHQGVVAYLKTFEYSTLEDIKLTWERRKETPFVVCLDELEDPHNVGAIIRSADAAGAHGIVIPKMRSCQVTETVIKTSSGAVFNIPIARVTNLKHALAFFKEEGLWIVGLTHKASDLIYSLDLRLPVVLVIGNEERGIRKGILEYCDFHAKIPMRGKVESLNASVAAGIALFEVVRQRLQPAGSSVSTTT